MTGAVLGADDESRYFSRCSAGIRDRSYVKSEQGRNLRCKHSGYLVNVHYRLPLMVALQVEVAHSHLSTMLLLASDAVLRKGAGLQVTRMVFIQVGSVMVLTTGKTALEMSVS